LSDHFIGHGGHTGFHQRLGEGDVGGEVEVGEEDLVFTEERIFLGERFLDLDHEFGGKNIGMVWDHFCSRLDVLLVRIARTNTGILFHQNLMAPLDELVGGGGQQGNAGFLGFDLTRDTDDHPTSLPPNGMGAREENAGLAAGTSWD